MDLFPSMFRLRNIFNPREADSSNGIGMPMTRKPIFDSTFTPDPYNPNDQEDDPVQNKLMELFSAPNAAGDRYNKYLESQPDKADYEPSWKRRLAGALAGFGAGLSSPELGYKLSSNIVEAPYKDAESHWEKQRLPLANAATAEAANRNQQINLLKDYIQTRHQNRMDQSVIGERADQAEHRKVTERQASETLLNTIAHQQALEAAAAANLKETTDYHTKTLSQRDKDNQARQQAERDRIAIAKQNADNSTSRTDIYRQNAESIIAYRDHLRSKYENEKNTPNAQKTAQELAVYNVLTTPGNTQKYSNFIEQDSHGKFIIHPPDKGTFESDDTFNNELKAYTELDNAIKAESDRIMKSTRQPSTTKSGTPKVEGPKKPKIITSQKLPGGV